MRLAFLRVCLVLAFASAVGAQSMTCTPKTGNAFEKAFCRNVTKDMANYKPTGLAANRTLSRTAIEFTVWSQDTGVIGSVLVKDPIGKNTVKLIYTLPVTPKAAAARTVVALGEILRVPATTKNVGWVIVVPAGLDTRGRQDKML